MLEDEVTDAETALTYAQDAELLRDDPVHSRLKGLIEDAHAAQDRLEFQNCMLHLVSNLAETDLGVSPRAG